MSNPSPIPFIQLACTTIGSAFGPEGAMVGSMIGVGLDSALTIIQAIGAEVGVNLAADYTRPRLEQMARRMHTRLFEPDGGATPVDHDLQQAFRDVLTAALVDIGGPDCFPKQWPQRPQPVIQQDVVYFHKPAGARMQREVPKLAQEAC